MAWNKLRLFGGCLASLSLQAWPWPVVLQFLRVWLLLDTWNVDPWCQWWWRSWHSPGEQAEGIMSPGGVLNMSHVKELRDFPDIAGKVPVRASPGPGGGHRLLSHAPAALKPLEEWAQSQHSSAKRTMTLFCDFLLSLPQVFLIFFLFSCPWCFERFIVLHCLSVNSFVP